MRSKSFGERIADVLIEEGLLLPNQLEEAIGIQKSEGGRLLKILTERQFVTDQDMVFSMGRCLNTPPVNLSQPREVHRRRVQTTAHAEDHVLVGHELPFGQN